MNIYLDHNIIISIHNDTALELRSKMEELKANGHVFPHSPAHCEEIAHSVVVLNKRKNLKQIKTLNYVSNKIAILPYQRGDAELINCNGAYFVAEDASKCYWRVAESYHRNKTAERISSIQIRDAAENPTRKAPIQANNMSPNQLLPAKRLEELLSSTLAHLKIDANQILSTGIIFDRIKHNFSVLEEFLERIHLEIESRGFHPEPPENYRSRLHDITHSIYACYCDIFVSNDARLRRRAQAAFVAIGSSCKVINDAKFIALPF